MTFIALITGATGGIGRAGGDGIAWRLGDGAACITGQVIAVDGGFTPLPAHGEAG